MSDYLSALEERRSQSVLAIAQLGDFRRGSIDAFFRRCGKPNCACAREDRPGDGPQLRLSYKLRGKTVQQTLSHPAQLRKAEREVTAFRRFQRLSAERVDVNEHICQLRPAETQELAEPPQGEGKTLRAIQDAVSAGVGCLLRLIVIARRKTGAFGLEKKCRKFGPAYARALRRRQGRLGDIWHVDEVFITIRGQRRSLWRAVEQDDDVLDILVTCRRDRRAAEHFFRKILKHQGRPPSQLVTDKLRSYAAARREVGLSATHRTGQYENNRAELSHEHTRERERRMRRFKSAAQVPRFLSVHDAIHNQFRLARHPLKATHHRLLREQAFTTWKTMPCVC